jgi:hypothetical protein
MKWIKRGLIFDPTKYKLANGCREFAQSPQTLVFEDFVRIYFSTRQKDNSTGKFVSHIAFVDFDKKFSEVLNISSDTVIELGETGTFDEHGIFPINILRHDGKIFAYTCGWSRRVSVSVETSTGLAFSDDDGLSFKKAGPGPVLTASLHEPVLVGDSFVKWYNNSGTFTEKSGLPQKPVNPQPGYIKLHMLFRPTELTGKKKKVNRLLQIV